jgi:peptide/nickel transport system permease protein
VSKRDGFWRRFAANRTAIIGLALLALVAAMALAAGAVFPRNPLHMVAPPELWPFEQRRFPLGTDSVGRDIAAIICHGARTAFAIGCLAAAVAVVVGVTIGALAGYFGGWVDDLLSRLTEIFQTVPHLVFVLAIVAVFGAKMAIIILAIGLTNWTTIARVARAEFLTWRERDFVAAARGVGMGDARIMLGEILPNALPPVIVLTSFTVAAAILFEAALAFLGFSDPDVASWGRLIGEGRQSLRSAWYISAVPGVAILLTVMALNLVGDALTDALDPRLKTALRQGVSRP